MAVTCCYAKKIWHLLDFKISSQIIYSWSNYEMAVIISITSLKKLYLFFFCPQEKYRMLSRAFWGLLGREHAVCTLLTHMAEACKEGLLTQTLSNAAAALAC